MPNADTALIAAQLCSVRTVVGYRDERSYELTPVVVLEPTVAIERSIAAVCNEPLIYSTLFAHILSGRRYSEDDAARFLGWGSEGWEDATHFVYLLLDERTEVAGAIDIKSPTLASAEIGYWLSEEHSGIMTNAVEAIAGLARDAGFSGLHALVRPDNGRSERVLLRAGFSGVGEEERNGKSYNRFERNL